MRILHVIHTPRYSGAEILVATLSKIHAEMGHHSRVVAINPVEKDFRPVIEAQRSLNTEWMAPSKSLSKIIRTRYIKHASDSFRPDITFAHSVIPAAYARLAGLNRVISVLHDANENDYGSLYFKLSEHILQYRSAGVITVSDTARENYTRRFGWPRTRHIPNGIDVRKFSKGNELRDSVRIALGFAPDDLVIAQIGRVSRVKRQHLSLQAMLPIIKTGTAMHLLFAGVVEDQTYLTELKKDAQEAGVDGNVHFLGPREDVEQLLSAADLYLMPSEKEAHSVAMIEALAAGLPIVASNIPSFAYSERYDGVHLLSMERVEDFTRAADRFLKERQRFNRQLANLDIKHTAQAYLEFGEECMS